MNKKVVFIIAQNDFRDEELLEPREILEKAEIEIKIAAETKEVAHGKLGTEINPDLSIKDISVSDFDAIIFVGGQGAAIYFDNQSVLKLVRDFNAAGKVVAAICIAPSILANAGILMGKRVTAFPTEEENLKNKGADYTAMPVEVDGKIITAENPDAAYEFAEKIVWELGE